MFSLHGVYLLKLTSLLVLTNQLLLLRTSLGFSRAPSHFEAITSSCHQNFLKTVMLSQILELLLRIINHHTKGTRNRRTEFCFNRFLKHLKVSATHRNIEKYCKNDLHTREEDVPARRQQCSKGYVQIPQQSVRFQSFTAGFWFVNACVCFKAPRLLME